jgi:hypothetical protein
MSGTYTPFWRCPAGGTQLGYIIESLVGPPNCNTVVPLCPPPLIFFALLSRYVLQLSHLPTSVRHPSSYFLSPQNGRRSTHLVRIPRATRSRASASRRTDDPRSPATRRLVSRASRHRDIRQRDRDGRHHRVLHALCRALG